MMKTYGKRTVKPMREGDACSTQLFRALVPPRDEIDAERKTRHRARELDDVDPSAIVRRRSNHRVRRLAFRRSVKNRADLLQAVLAWQIWKIAPARIGLRRVRWGRPN
jgi:hypothetical protein